jgi:hypothetical protein
MRVPSQRVFRFLALALLLGLLAPGQAAAQGTSTPRTCNRSAFLNMSTATTSLLAPKSTDRQAADTIFICGYQIFSAGTTTVLLETGTQVSTPCDTNPTAITPTYSLVGGENVQDGSSFFRGLSVPAGLQLCAVNSGAVNVGIMVYYDNNPL